MSYSIEFIDLISAAENPPNADLWWYPLHAYSGSNDNKLSGLSFFLTDGASNICTIYRLASIDGSSCQR